MVQSMNGGSIAFVVEVAEAMCETAADIFHSSNHYAADIARSENGSAVGPELRLYFIQSILNRFDKSSCVY